MLQGRGWLMIGYIEHIDILSFRKRWYNISHQNLMVGSNGPSGPYPEPPGPGMLRGGSPLILIAGDEGEMTVDGEDPRPGDVDRVNGAYPLSFIFTSCVVDPSDSWYRGAYVEDGGVGRSLKPASSMASSSAPSTVSAERRVSS
jgi:hypothetical protein